ncbi:MAG: serine/threonine-protein kinase [Acidobacteria bacterium]|nr:serine/threonine-protein kinase [Acidobacteriota bacterium]
MALAAGTKLGPYEIQSPLGAGGMGEVYRARDTRLGRDVALKILPESFSRDDERLERFEQEACTVAALNHPNILSVFDIGQNQHSPFLISELLEGETLRAALDRGRLSQRKAIEYGIQIADGLAAAHDRGVVHRDLKPENIFVTKDARIKILDFGLAKLVEPLRAGGQDSVTLTGSHTVAGIVLGTASYMAPEQVRGEPADRKTDIFALGAVLYEMLKGSRAFGRDTAAETMAAVLREDPPELTAPDRPVSSGFDRIVRRCLEKDPEQRFQSARDLSFALAAVSGSDSSPAAPMTKTSKKVSRVLWAAVVVLLLVMAVAGWFLGRSRPSGGHMQFAIPIPGEVSHMALSADGSILAFVSPDEKSGIPVLSVQRVGSPEARVLAGTEGANYPFWSPDGAYLGFFANGKLQKIAIAGGPPQVLASVWAARGGAWGRGNVILYEPDTGSPLWRVNSDGSGAAPVTDRIFSPQEQSHRWPVFLPDGNHFLFWAGNFGGLSDDRLSGIFSSSLDHQERKLVTLARSSFAVDGSHLYYADAQRQLVANAFDADRAVISGSPIVIAKAVALQPSTYWASFTAENGTLVYNSRTEAARSALTWMDRTGRELRQIGEPAVQCNPTLSPDGNRVAVDISDERANNVDIWLESTQGGGNARFTFDPAEEVVGVWSRDGKTLALRSAGGTVGMASLVLKAANGLERERIILRGGGTEDLVPNSWSADDRQILFTRQSSSGYYLELEPSSGGQATVFLRGPGNQTNGLISPDGKWVAYASDESGSWEIYVTTFPTAAGKWQVSRGGGIEPRWRGDGNEIFYLAAGGMLTAVPVRAEGTFSTGTPTPLFQFHGRAAISSTDVFSYDVSKDGKRFLVNRYVKPDYVPPLTIMLGLGRNR